MVNFTDSAESKQIDQREHNEDASAKRVALRAQDPLTGSWVNVAAVDNGDGTYSISTSTSRWLPSTLKAFVTTITTAGTRVQLASNTLTNGAIIQAPSTNTGLVYIGGSNVSSSAYGAELQPGQSTSVAVSNTNAIYADSSVNGNKVSTLGS